MKIEYTLAPLQSAAMIEVTAPEQSLGSRAPRVACLLALAHRFDSLVRSGEVRDYADIARLGRVSRARVSQILKLLTLAPSIQEHLLLLPPCQLGEETITERDLRAVVREPRWDHQRALFARVLGSRKK